MKNQAPLTPGDHLQWNVLLMHEAAWYRDLVSKLDLQKCRMLAAEFQVQKSLLAGKSSKMGHEYPFSVPVELRQEFVKFMEAKFH
ncbi:hypothetical protein HDU98_001089 [Podochytrium sp. JEL0797]|nr:hypothetical protein HDU98_001089 [Podochytrium sp. JEL0797]